MNINQLPFEVLSLIFNRYLTVRDNFTCSRVCKLWNFLILNLKLKNLVISQNSLPINDKWCFTYELVDCRNSIVSHDLNFIEFQLKRAYFSNLRHLYIHLINLSYLCQTFVRSLNYLYKLERLEVQALILLRKPESLNLLNLKSLNIKKVHGNQLTLTTPKLFQLKTQSDLKNLKFISKEKIRYLECVEYESQVTEFTNLEYFYCFLIENVDNTLFTSLTKLKEIHLEHDVFTFYNLLNQKQQNRSDVTIYYQGIGNLEYLEDNLNYGSDSLNEDNIQIYLNNYSNLANKFTFIKYINYNCWESNNVCNDLLKKLVNLNGVYVRKKIDDEFKFIEFLNRCVNFSILKLNSSLLTQTFYNQLPIYRPTIKCLEITLTTDEIDNFDFNFLFQLKFLSTFSSNKKFKLEFIYQLFKDLKYFANYSNDNLKIEYFNHSFEVCKNDDEIYFFDNLDELYNILTDVIDI